MHFRRTLLGMNWELVATLEIAANHEEYFFLTTSTIGRLLLMLILKQFALIRRIFEESSDQRCQIYLMFELLYAFQKPTELNL